MLPIRIGQMAKRLFLSIMKLKKGMKLLFGGKDLKMKLLKIILKKVIELA